MDGSERMSQQRSRRSVLLVGGAGLLGIGGIIGNGEWEGSVRRVARSNTDTVRVPTRPDDTTIPVRERKREQRREVRQSGT
jgi:hypothetical protein